jgi:dUTP pyrophosphatase
MTAVRVAFKRLPEGDGLPLPSYMSEHAVPTGFSIALPIGYEAQVRPRSGLAIRSGVTCLNSPGTIDADYRGHVRVVLANFGAEPFVIRRGDRIAQIVVAPVSRASFELVDELPSSERGSGGFGSTDR